MGSTKGDELVKYITEQVVTYIETPKAERSRARKKEHWTVKWFGMIPFSLSVWSQNLRSKKTSGSEVSEDEVSAPQLVAEAEGMLEEQMAGLAEGEQLAEEEQSDLPGQWQADPVN